MTCKTNINGNVEIKQKANIEQTCFHCDGCGIVYNKICKLCNGHGVIVYDTLNHRVNEYSPTQEQLAAMETLGGVA